MGLSKKLMAQAGRPSGPLGRLMGTSMNRMHRGVYLRGIGSASLGPGSRVLDVGCGGGQAVKMLAKMVPEGHVCGVDHSPDMVELAKRANKAFIQSGRVEIRQGSVSSLPYADDTFDVITAFETIQFWPNINEDLKEVYRVLKPQGELLIVNR